MMIATGINKWRRWKSVRRPAEKTPAGASAGGFTIIEVMLALVIFSVGLLAVASMQTSSVTGNTSSKKNTMAVEYASDYMENLLALGVDKDIDDMLGYPQLDAGGPYEPQDFIGEDHDGDDADDLPYYPVLDSLFDLTWSVADDTSRSGLPAEGPVKVISVTVRWANGNRAITLNSIKGAAL